MALIVASFLFSITRWCNLSCMDKIMLLLRFMKTEYVDPFMRGELYLNPLEYFAALEGDTVRSDAHEGAQFARQL